MNSGCGGWVLEKVLFIPTALLASFLCTLLLLPFSVATTLAQSANQAQPQAQPKQESLVEAARNAKTKKNKSAPRKVYTDEDVSALSGSVSVLGQNPPSKVAAAQVVRPDAPAETTEGTKSGKNDQEYWHGRARNLLDQIDAVDKEIAKVEEVIQKKARDGVYEAGVDQRMVEYLPSGVTHEAPVRKDKFYKNELEKKKQDLQKKMEVLMEEGRKAGAPAGWFR